MVTLLLSAVLVGVVGCAALTDIRTRRIPNQLTASALLVALVLRAVLGGSPLLAGLLGAGLALVAVLPLFAMRGIGGGDAKLLIAVGACLGPQGLLVACVGTAVAGGIMSLAAAVRRGVILPVLLNTGSLAGWMLTLGRRGERTTLVSPGAVSVPYGVAIALGTAVALYLGYGP
jgi:prepilin peptidase CpaA